VQLGVRGLLIAGTTGEGPWMTDDQRSVLLRAIVAANRGRLILAMQVTDNSAARILVNARRAKVDGADIAVIAPPHFLLNATPANLLAHYRQAIRQCPLPVGIYDRGRAGMPDEILPALYAERRVVMIKDSSNDPKRMQIALAARRKGVTLLNGYEFDCVTYLKAGYDGSLLGGGIFNGYLAGQIADRPELQTRMNRLMYDVYGGEKIECWMSGLKHLLVQMGIFGTAKNYLNYPLTPACKKNIVTALRRDAAFLFP
jgi:4-hydroxy-tetrahydrodipicolinate synthase